MKFKATLAIAFLSLLCCGLGLALALVLYDKDEIGDQVAQARPVITEAKPAVVESPSIAAIREVTAKVKKAVSVHPPRAPAEPTALEEKIIRAYLDQETPTGDYEEIRWQAVQLNGGRSVTLHFRTENPFGGMSKQVIKMTHSDESHKVRVEWGSRIKNIDPRDYGVAILYDGPSSEEEFWDAQDEAQDYFEQISKRAQGRIDANAGK